MKPYVPRVAFITGGGAGIGKALAESFHARGSRVIVAGPTVEKLRSLAERNRGMEFEVLDVADAASVAGAANRVRERHGDVDLVVNNAGIQNLLDFRNDVASEAISREIDVNLKGVVYVANAFLPMLRSSGRGRLVNVGSALGFVPRAAAPVYSASKAAVHSFTISLRHQCRGTSVRIVELIPPGVRTELHRGQTRESRRQMTIEAFTGHAMRGLDRDREEIAVGLARVLRAGSRLAPPLFLEILNRSRH